MKINPEKFRRSSTIRQKNTSLGLWAVFYGNLPKL